MQINSEYTYENVKTTIDFCEASEIVSITQNPNENTYSIVMRDDLGRIINVPRAIFETGQILVVKDDNEILFTLEVP